MHSGRLGEDCPDFNISVCLVVCIIVQDRFQMKSTFLLFPEFYTLVII